MKYIKTPVSMDDWGDLVSSGELLATGYGPQRAEQMREVSAVLNAHDALVTERDALHDACEAFTIKYVTVLDAMDDPFDIKADWLDDQFAGEIVALNKALALVHGG